MHKNKGFIHTPPVGMLQVLPLVLYLFPVWFSLLMCYKMPLMEKVRTFALPKITVFSYQKNSHFYFNDRTSCNLVYWSTIKIYNARLYYYLKYFQYTLPYLFRLFINSITTSPPGYTTNNTELNMYIAPKIRLKHSTYRSFKKDLKGIRFKLRQDM